MWPYGYTAYLDEGIPDLPDTRAVLLDQNGIMVARQQDVIAFVGSLGPENTFYICPRTQVILVYAANPR
jgi:hypothetical protein